MTKKTDEQIMAELIEKHGELVSTVSIDMDDWPVEKEMEVTMEQLAEFEAELGEDFWMQDVPTCEEEQCPCQEDQ